MTQEDLAFSEQQRPVAYGFIDDVETMRNETFVATVQRPFRGRFLWLWGDPQATLHSLYISAHNQLLGPMLFAEMYRPVAPNDFQRLCAGGYTAPPPSRRNLIGTPVHLDLYQDHLRPHLILPPQQVGTSIRFRCDGSVQGIVLVGLELV